MRNLFLKKRDIQAIKLTSIFDQAVGGQRFGIQVFNVVRVNYAISELEIIRNYRHYSRVAIFSFGLQLREK